jgi:hypothetical protein
MGGRRAVRDGDPVVVTFDNERLGFFWVLDGGELSFLSLGEARDLVLTTRWQEHEADAIEDGWTLEQPQFPAEIRVEHDSVRLDDRLDEILAPFLGA